LYLVKIAIRFCKHTIFLKVPFERFSQKTNCINHIFHQRVRAGIIIVGCGVFRIKFDSLVIVLDGSFRLPKVIICYSPVVVGCGFSRIEFDGLVIVLDGSFMAVQIRIG